MNSLIIFILILLITYSIINQIKEKNKENFEDREN